MNYSYNWYNEPKNQTVCLYKDFLSKLTLSCINKINANSLERKIKELKKYRLAKVSIKKWLYGYSNGGIEISNLMKMCDFLRLPYNSLNGKFLFMGQLGKKSKIKTFIKPKFPIDLSIPEIGTIIGAQASDASLNLRGWFYYNNKEELRNKISNTIQKIFGDVQSILLFDRFKRKYGLQFPAIVARAINFLEIPYGRKTIQNYSLPKILMNGPLQMQKNYFSQRYSDEGSIRFIKDGRNRWHLFCYQAIDLNPILNKKELDKLKDIIIKKGRLKSTPSKTDFKVYSKISNLKKFKIEDYKPNFLLNEQILLKNFGIKSHLMLTKIKYYFKTDKLSAYWQSIVYDQKDILKFHKYIGFNDSEKNRKLEECSQMINA